MHNISFGMMNKVYGKSLEKLIGEIIKIDVDKNGVGWGPFLRVKIWVDITKALLQGSLINPLGKPLWIVFKYERLSNFYFKCGIIKHPSTGCPNISPNIKLHEKDQS